MNSYSQFGEDLLVWKYFVEKSSGFFLEAGANHPTKGSQTCLFEEHGWKGILVEPIAKNCELLRRFRPGSRIFQCALGAPEQRGRVQMNVATGDNALSGLAVNSGVVVERTEEVDLRTLDDVLAEADNPKVDLMSIDVEGFELQVFRGLDFLRHQPALVLVEDHLHSLSVHRHLVRNGYRLVKRTGLNNWYIPRRQPFHLATWKERLELFRKMFLSLPFRKFKRWRQSRKPAR